jgi:hypothetical protein
MRDGYLLMQLCSTFHRLGCPETNRVPLTLTAAARALGAASVGGSQRRLVVNSLLRLRAVSVQASTIGLDGQAGIFTGGLITSSWIAARGARDGWVEFSPELAALIRRGLCTFTHEPTAVELLERDEYAWRLWAFLEGETLPRRFTYPLFGGAGHVPAIADLLRMRSVAQRRTAERIQLAANAIQELDPRYVFSMRRMPRAGWCLEVIRHPLEIGHSEHVRRGTRGTWDGHPKQPSRAMDAAIRSARADPPSYSPSYPTSNLPVVAPLRKTRGPESIGSLIDIWMPDPPGTLSPAESGSPDLADAPPRPSATAGPGPTRGQCDRCSAG